MLRVRPITLRDANAFVDRLHRHHHPARGCKFTLSIVDGDGELRGVLIASRPVARHFDDGLTIEVVRCCTDGIRNGCSKLYGAAVRISREMGYERIITYTLPEEGGASLRGAGWTCVGTAGGGLWHREGRPRKDDHPTMEKMLWEVGLY